MNGRPWTKEEQDILIALYPDHFACDIAERIGRGIRAVYARARKLGLYTSKEHMSIVGREKSNHPRSVATRFKAGHIPANKGVKMPPEVYAKVKPTMFRKGHMPINHRPVGTECVRGDGYTWVKVAEPNRWRQKQRIIWEKHYGPIPKGYNVQFRNKDRKDFRLENLYIISRAEQMRNENSLIASYPKPLADIIRLKGVVNRQIHKAERNGK